MVAVAKTREAVGEVGKRDGHDGRAGAKLLGRAVRPRALRFGEALSVPARDLAELPLPPSLVLRAAGLERLVRVELGASAPEPSEGELVLDADEWRAIGLGAEADRLWPADLAALLRRKASDPSFRITGEVALAGAQPDPAEAWSAAQVLERIGAEVVAVELP